jgi:hypothetical protein
MFGSNNGSLSLNQTPGVALSPGGVPVSDAPAAPPPPSATVSGGVNVVTPQETPVAKLPETFGNATVDSPVVNSTEAPAVSAPVTPVSELPKTPFTPIDDNTAAEEYRKGPFYKNPEPAPVSATETGASSASELPVDSGLRQEEPPSIADQLRDSIVEPTATTKPVEDTATVKAPGPAPVGKLAPSAETVAPVVTETAPVQENLQPVIDALTRGLETLDANVTTQLQEINNTLKTIAIPQSNSAKVTETATPMTETPQTPQPAQSASGAVEGYSIGPAKPASPAVPAARAGISDAPTNRIT